MNMTWESEPLPYDSGLDGLSKCCLSLLLGLLT